MCRWCHGVIFLFYQVPGSFRLLSEKARDSELLFLFVFRVEGIFHPSYASAITVSSTLLGGWSSLGMDCYTIQRFKVF